MNNVLLLIKANITNTLGLNRFLKEPSKSERTKMIFIGLAILLTIVVVFSSTLAYFLMVADVLVQLNALPLLLVVSFINVSLVSLFMSIYKASGYLFSFKDYDLLMSLPVKTSEVLISKLLQLYNANFLVSIIIGLPSLIVYGIKSSSEITYYIFALIAMFFIPLIPMIIGAAFSFVLGKVATRFKSTNIVMIIGTFVLIILLMVVPSFMNNISPEFIQDITGLIDTLSRAYFSITLYVNALVDIHILSFIGFVLVGMIPFVFFVTIFAKGFKSINSKMNERFKSSSYKMSSLAVSSPLKALYRKEISFYFSSYIYVVNTAIGVIMMTIFSVGIGIFGGEKVAEVLSIPMLSQLLVPTSIAVLSICICLTCTTASSVSLEGNKLWIIKSLPLKTIEVMKGKILVNLTIIIPALILNTMILAVSFKMTPVLYLLLLGITTLYAFLISLIGIIVNLYLPKLEWKSYMVVVKQSASVIISMLIGVILVAIPILIYIFIKPADFNLYSLFVILGLLITNLSLWTVIKTKGVKMFNKL
ncbi:MAG: hypothetical protein WDA24_01570 [Tissierellales bacterium]